VQHLNACRLCFLPPLHFLPLLQLQAAVGALRTLLRSAKAAGTKSDAASGPGGTRRAWALQCCAACLPELCMLTYGFTKSEVRALTTPTSYLSRRAGTRTLRRGPCLRVGCSFIWQPGQGPRRRNQ